MRVAAGSLKAAWLSDPLPYLAGALIFAAILLGGGGAEGPLLNGILEGLGALLLCAIAALHFTGRPLPSYAAGPIWLTIAALLAIGLQLIPLPPSLWSGLPGREVAVAMDNVVGGSLSWRPLSLDPEATRRSVAALLLPLPILLVAVAAPRKGLLFMLRSVLAGAFASAALGAIQLALGSPDSLAPYGGPVPGAASGLFANSNHQAALMLCALVASGILIRLDDPSFKIRTQRGSWRAHLAWLWIPIFGVMAIAAMSRAGWALLIPAIIAAVLIATGRRRFARLLVLLLVGLAIIAGALLSSAAQSPNISSVQAMLLDSRLISFPDLLYTLQQFWPAGSGLGTFVPVFKANENLDLVSSAYLNHAHNDLIELLIEMGALGALLLLLFGAALIYRFWRIFRGRSSAEATAALGGGTMIALLLLHSLVDYPLRNDAVAAVAGLALGLILARAERGAQEQDAKQKRRSSSRGFTSLAQSAAARGGS